jgi:hypothetical protein
MDLRICQRDLRFTIRRDNMLDVLSIIAKVTALAAVILVGAALYLIFTDFTNNDD